MNYRLWDRIKDWLLLFILLTASMIVLVARNEPMLRGLRAISLESTAWVEGRFSWVGGYLRALDENDALREENIALSSEVARSREAITENDRLMRLIGFSDTTSYPLRAARVVAKDVTRQRNYLTIDLGSNDSIAVGMPVVDQRGVIGRVEHVSAHYALVMPYLNTDFRLPARIQSLQADGVVRWTGDARDQLLLEYISRTEPVLRGQMVVTSDASGSFPPGYPIGFVDSVASLPGRNEVQVLVRPISPIDRSDYVFVILTSEDQELAALQNWAERTAAD